MFNSLSIYPLKFDLMCINDLDQNAIKMLKLQNFWLIEIGSPNDGIYEPVRTYTPSGLKLTLIFN
ncbi:MAG: hypothetical protein A7315_11685 [Candidatus Altiarchaeales archaeon WOR_SM1_79]|nr:MAG: hypothetical protein A7315_11685 [Candidatus Altiarchaeales archaeon WOR_SM1_79]